VESKESTRIVHHKLRRANWYRRQAVEVPHF
jgi:hypothetical protein